MIIRCLRRRLLPLLAVAALFISAAALQAGGWPRFSLPNPGTKNKSGLHLMVDSDGLEGNGYRAVRIQITPWPVVPLAADRQIRVVIKPHSFASARSPEVSQVIELPEGSTSVKAIISVPQTSVWHSMGIDTYEGGRKWEDLSSKNMGWASGRNGWEWTEDRPSMLFIDPDVPPRWPRDAAISAFQATSADPTPTNNLPDVRALIWLYGDPNNAAAATGMTAQQLTSTKATDVMLLSGISNLNRVEILPPAELPRRWIDFSQYDLIVLSYDDLQLMADKHQAELAAIRDWLLGGPLLMVYGAGDSYEHLAEIEKRLNLAALTPNDGGEPAHRGWEVPQQSNAGDLKPALKTFNSRQRIVQRTPVRRTAIKPKTPANGAPAAPAQTGAPASVDPPFLMRPAGLGCVVSIGASSPFPGQSTDWSWIFNSVADNHWRWYQRNGFSLHRTNDDYWKFLIPGVGRAPVWSFLLLVSLFAVVIGPVNYLFLNRARRLYLLLITVPSGALVITLALFAYAVVADGLGIRLRSRSFTDLDQRTGLAACWSRQSYYAAITPSEGLIFPEDTTVFPIFYDPMRQSSGSGQPDSALAWQEGQHLRSGYLASRTATQFMVQRVAKTEARLIVREAAEGGQPPQVENRLHGSLRYLVLCDSRSAHYVAPSLASGATAALQKVDADAVEKELTKLMDAVKPALPEANQNNHDNIISLLMPRRGGWLSVDGSSSDPAMAASLLETNILRAMSQAAKLALSPQTYVAIIDRSPVVPVGIPHAQEEASLHILTGHY